MHYQELDLDITSPWQLPQHTVECSYKSYGVFFYEWIEEYLETFDPIVFDRNKHRIQELYAQHFNNPFYFRLAKIIYLYQQWNRYQRWNDPMIARQLADRLYIIHPGQDRWIVMKHFDVKRYNFLVIDEEFTPELLPKLQAQWTESKLEFRFVEDRQVWTMLNRDLKFDTTVILKQWFSFDSRGLPTIASPNIISARQKLLDAHKKRSS